MYVDEATYDQYWDRWDELEENESSGSCSTCRHNGSCDDLHYCGGTCWESMYAECAQCGKRIVAEDAEFSDEDGNVWCSEECVEKWEKKNEEESEDEDDDV